MHTLVVRESRYLRCHQHMGVNDASEILDNGGCVNELATDVDAAKRNRNTQTW